MRLNRNFVLSSGWSPVKHTNLKPLDFTDSFCAKSPPWPHLSMSRTLSIVAASGILTCSGFVLFLAHRTDYAGHYAAGFGGTLLALGWGIGMVPNAISLPAFGRWVFTITATAICLGALLESSVFKLAIFDPVDFCNQSIGAVVAGLAFFAGSPPIPISGKQVQANTYLAVVFLVLGFYWAFS